MKTVFALLAVGFCFIGCHTSTNVSYCYAKSIRNSDGSWSQRTVQMSCFSSASDCNNNLQIDDGAPVKGTCRLTSMDESTTKPVNLW